MENASKALIIAGAILLAILLISLGIMIFQQAQDTVSNSGMSQAEIQAFNSKFTKFEGGSVKGSEVKAMINEVRASNSSDQADNVGRGIALILVDGSTTTSDTRTDDGVVTEKVRTADIKSSAKYKVEVTKKDKSGYVAEMTITIDKGTTSTTSSTSGT